MEFSRTSDPAFSLRSFFFYCLFNIVIIGLGFSIYSSFNLDKEHFQLLPDTKNAVYK